MNRPELSVVIPTCDRPAHLAAALASLSEIAVPAEIVVVDGSSDDRTAAVIQSAREDFGDRLVCLREHRREGFVRAVNKGFRIAAGRCLTWLNDDARPVRGSLESAVEQLSAGPPDVGLVAMFHRWQSPRNVAFSRSIGKRPYQLCHVRGTLYANFGVGLRSTFERLDFFDERYYFYAADPDFSLKVWEAGMSVVPAAESFIDHDEHADDRRGADAERGRADNAELFHKWNLPPANAVRNDFEAENPCTLRRAA